MLSQNTPIVQICTAVHSTQQHRVPASDNIKIIASHQLLTRSPTKGALQPKPKPHANHASARPACTKQPGALCTPVHKRCSPAGTLRKEGGG
jgi:hypothetical protein